MVCLLVLVAALAASASGFDPVALPPADDYVPEACVHPIQDFHNHDKWVRLTDDLWFQANGARKAEDKKWRRISDPLQCVGASQCSVTVSHISSFAHSLSWGASASIGFDLWKKIVGQASAYVNMSTEHVTSSAVSYTCTAKENQTVYLAARVQYYEVFGYAAEMVRGEVESLVHGNVTIPTAVWGWKVPCRLMLRSPKVSADGSIAGARRCVVTNGTAAVLQEEQDQDSNDVPLVQLA